MSNTPRRIWTEEEQAAALARCYERILVEDAKRRAADATKDKALPTDAPEAPGDAQDADLDI